MEILKFTVEHMVHWVQMSILLKTEGVDICGGNKEEVMGVLVKKLLYFNYIKKLGNIKFF